MITRDLRFEGFSTRDWVRLKEVFVDPSERGREPGQGPKHGGVIAVTRGERLLKLLSTDAGRLDRTLQPWPESLETLASRHRARFAVAIEMGALDELMERLAQRVQREHDFLEQSLLFVDILRELETEGRIQVWPWRLSSWPVPKKLVLTRVLDALCPDGKCLAFAAFSGGELFTAIVLRRRGQGFDSILGPDDLRREMGLTSGDFRRDYRHLARAIERRAGPLAIGCYGEIETLRALGRDPSPGAWAAAVAARDVILSPVTPAVALPLGVDVGRAAYRAVRDLAERVGASAWFGPDSPFAPALERVRGLGREDLQALLGFDPWQLLRRLVARDPRD